MLNIKRHKYILGLITAIFLLYVAPYLLVEYVFKDWLCAEARLQSERKIRVPIPIKYLCRNNSE